MIVVGIALGYLAIGALAAAWASPWVAAADAVALALLWPIYGPILLERGPRGRRDAQLEDRVEAARLALAAAVAEAERIRRIDRLRAQIDALQAEADALGNKPSDPDVPS